jgi:hypothetical protein
MSASMASSMIGLLGGSVEGDVAGSVDEGGSVDEPAGPSVMQSPLQS